MALSRKLGLFFAFLLILCCCGIIAEDPNPDDDAVLHASFSYAPGSPALGQAVLFMDASTGSPTSWQWSFGDETSSTAQNPTHVFTTVGSKTVTLTVRNQSGSDSESRTVTVSALVAAFTYKPALPSPGRAVQFTDTSSGTPTSWQWDFGDGATSAVQNPSHTYMTERSYPVRLIVRNASGSATADRTLSVTTADVVPADRLMDWSYAGVPSGIPYRTTIYRTLTPSNTLSEINAAIAACPANQVVYLAPGTYNLGQIMFGSKAGVTLRGAGPGRTIINTTAPSAISGTDLNFREADGLPLIGDGGLTGGSTHITLASSPAVGFRIGNLIQITQDDHPDSLGLPGIGVYHRTGLSAVWGMSPTRNLRFTSRITAISGTTMTLATPLPYSYSPALNPKAYPLRSGPGASQCGVESLSIRGNGHTDRAIDFAGADRCWFKDLEISNVVGSIGIIYLRHSSQCEIRRCYVHDAAGFPNQSDGYAFFLYYGCSYVLAIDNIARRVGAGVVINGSSGSAVLYNYTEDVRRAGHSWLDQGFFINHGPHAIMNLVEGNILQRIQNDGYHGSTSHSLLYRNNVHGVRTGTAEPRRLIDLCRGSYYHTVIGNVIGDPSWTPAEYEYSLGDTTISCVYILGFPGMDSSSMGAFASVPWDNWTKSTNAPDADVAVTLIRHGNYDYHNEDVVWDEDIVSRTLPASLFYASKPDFFGALSWPPIGPDVDGLVTDIPATARWDAFIASGNLDDLFRDR